MKTTAIDQTGRRFGRLVVLRLCEPSGKRKRRTYLCRCDCGNEIKVVGESLVSGNTVSCRCFQRQRQLEGSLKHGKSRQRIHNIWCSMRQRCENKNNQAYAAYGGRGIRVCDRWQIFENFLADMGEPMDGMSLDRYPDKNGNYEPGNVRWATKTHQANNRRSGKYLEFNGRSQTMAEWETEYGLRKGQLWERLNRGWTIERAITTRRP